MARPGFTRGQLSDMKKVKIAVGLILLTPLIVLNFWGARMSLWVNEEIQFNEDLRAGTVQSEDAPVAPTSPMEWFRDRSTLKNTFSPDALNEDRIVSISVIVEIEELLAPGEIRPEDVFLPLYAEARAPRYLMQFCQDVLVTLGSGCAVQTSKTSINRDGLIEISGSLAYVPGYEMGKPQKQEGAKLISTGLSMASRSDAELPENDSVSRQAYLGKAEEICADLRILYGSCVVTRVGLNAVMLRDNQLQKLPDGTAPERLGAWIEISVYAVDTDEVNAEILSRLEALTSH